MARHCQRNDEFQIRGASPQRAGRSARRVRVRHVDDEAPLEVNEKVTARTTCHNPAGHQEMIMEVTSADVVWCYRNILGREPEVVGSHWTPRGRRRRSPIANFSLHDLPGVFVDKRVFGAGSGTA